MSVIICSAIKQFPDQTYFFITTTHTFEVDVVLLKRISMRLLTVGRVTALI
jgi:hypothetical protein